MSYRLEQSTDEDFYNDKNHPEGTRKPLAFDVKDEGCQAHKDLEEPLKKARMTMKSSEPEATPQTGRGCLVTWPPEDNQQVYTEEQRYRQGFLDGFRAGQEAGLKLAQDVMNCYMTPRAIMKDKLDLKFEFTEKDWSTKLT
jgi:hypothetical protein